MILSGILIDSIPDSLNFTQTTISEPSAKIILLSGDANFAVFGEVVGVHMRDDCIIDGRFEIKMNNPVSRLGYRDYAIIKDYFELKRPDDI